MVGRSEEIGLAAGAFAAGAAGVLIVSAEGLGASRLARGTLRHLAGSGGSSLSISATRATRDVPLGAFAGHLGTGMIERAVASPASASEIARAVTQLRSRLTAEPRLLLVDEVHELDESSAVVMHHLIHDRYAFAVLCSREGEPLASPIDDLLRSGALERLDLGPLEYPEMGRLCAAVLGGVVDASTRRRLAALTRGNLVYLRELLIEGRQSGALSSSDGVWSWRGPLVPRGRLAHFVEASFARAGPAAQPVLELLALGDEVELELLLGLVDPTALESAEYAGLVTVERTARRAQVRLAHPMFGAVLLQSMTELSQRRWAAALADCIVASGSRRGSDLLRVALLERRAHREVSVERLLGAAQAARSLDDLELWEELARAAWEVEPSLAARCQLEECLVWQGRFSEIDDELGSANQPSAELVAHHARTRAAAEFFGRNHEAAAFALLEDAEAALAGSTLEADTRSHRAELAMFAGSFTLSERLALDVLADARALPVARATAYGALVPSLAMCGRVDGAHAIAEEALAYIFSRPDPPLWEGAGVVVGDFLAALLGGRLAELDPVLEDLYAEATAKPLDPLAGVWALMLGRGAVARGDLRSGCERLNEAAALLRQNDPGRVLGWCLGALAQAEGQRGCAGSANRAVLEMDEEQLPAMRSTRVDIEIGRAWALAATGDIDAARHVALDAVSDELDRGAFGTGGYALCEAIRLGARDVHELVDQIRPCVEGALLGTIADLAGAIERNDVGDLLRAAETFRGLGAHLWSAEVAGLALVRAIERHDVADAPRAALARSEALAACTDARTPLLAWATRRSSEAGLTRRELDVSRLAAAGLTSGQIAQRLFVSPRTVENHLAHVYRKLNVSTRAELTALIGGDGAPQP